MRIMVRLFQALLMVATFTFGISAVVACTAEDHTENTCIRQDDANKDPLGCGTNSLREPSLDAAGVLFAVTAVATGVGALAMNIVVRQRKTAD
jgi:hypothetical protein